jgi:hypothetical protein
MSGRGFHISGYAMEEWSCLNAEEAGQGVCI